MEGTGIRGDGGSQRPVSEHTTIQQVNDFAGDRSKFREWSEKLLNALGQVNVKSRKAVKFLNGKLDTLGGALQDQDDDHVAWILSLWPMTFQKDREIKQRSEGFSLGGTELKFVKGPRLAHEHGDNRAHKEDLMAEPRGTGTTAE